MAARRSALAVWLNPATILIGSVLGYMDPLFALPAVAALVTAVNGWPTLAGALIAAAGLTKPQAIFVAPAVALAIWNVGDRRDAWRRSAAASGGATMVAVAAIGPIVAHGAFWNMIWGLGSLTRDAFLSGNACNLWWLSDYLRHVTSSMHSMSVWAAAMQPAELEPILPAVKLDPFRVVGLMLTFVASGWAIRQARRARDLWLLSAVGAFLVHAYATLAVSVHENHLFAAVPLLALASAGRPRFVPIFMTVSAIMALNLNLFYGIGSEMGYAIPRGITILDATVVLAMVNCATFVWHATVLKGECSPARQKVHSSLVGCTVDHSS